MTRQRAGNAVAAIILLVALHALVPCDSGAGDEGPMTVEEVVRLFVQGTSPEELIRRIERAQVDFDLAEDMVEELRLAGVPEEVLEAMARRQLELHPPQAPESPAPVEPESPDGLTVRLSLRGGGKARPDGDARALRVVDLVPPQTLEQLGVRDPSARITDVAIYVACHSATHVPDHWRGESPLGRDFHSATRHRMLAFHAGATAVPPGAARGWLDSVAITIAGVALPETEAWSVLDLQVPEEILVPLDADAGHDLAIGIAVRIADRYYRVVSTTFEDFVPSEHGRTVEVAIERPGNLDAASIKVEPVD